MQDIREPPGLVVPAKAGIHSLASGSNWIPAFAGMTSKGTLRMPNDRYAKSRLLIAVLAMLLVISSESVAGKATGASWSNTRQLVVVTTADWDADSGRLQAFERTQRGWRLVAPAVPVSIGRSGLAWGLGLHPAQSGLAKREGDGRSPAGVFRIGEAFGYAASARTALPYTAMQASHWCMDVSTSKLYNRIVDSREVGEAAVAGSTEPMRRDLHADGDQRYRLGFVIEHNAQARPGAGSCIFAHLWKAAGESTAGCTAMTEPAMRDLLAWLQPGDDPVFVLLPAAEYARLRAAWQLPDPAVHDRTPDAADTEP